MKNLIIVTAFSILSVNAFADGLPPSVLSITNGDRGVYDAQFSPNDHYVLTLSYNSDEKKYKIHLTDFLKQTSVYQFAVEEREGVIDQPTRIKFTADGRRFFTSTDSYDSVFTYYSISAVGVPLYSGRNPKSNHFDREHQFSPSGNLVIALSEQYAETHPDEGDGELEVLHVDEEGDATVVATFTQEDMASSDLVKTSVTYSQDETKILYSTSGNDYDAHNNSFTRTKLKVVDLSTGNTLYSFSSDSGSQRDGLRRLSDLSQDGKILAIQGLVGRSHLVSIIDLASGKIQNTVDVMSDGLLGLHLSPDGKRLIAWRDQGNARIIDTQTGALIAENGTLESLFKFPSNLFSPATVSFSKDGTKFILTQEYCTGSPGSPAPVYSYYLVGDLMRGQFTNNGNGQWDGGLSEFSADGGLIVFTGAGYSHTTQVISAETGASLLWVENLSPIASGSHFSNSGRLMLYGDWDNEKHTHNVDILNMGIKREY